MPGDDYYEYIEKMVTVIDKKATTKNVLGEETYIFTWNNPSTEENLKAFEKRNTCSLPKELREFLLISNGATLFKSEYEDDGYKLLSIEEMEKITQDMKDDGYDIPHNCYCFLQCLFSDDVLLLDLNKDKYCILDGDVGYPTDEWEYISSDINTFFIRLCQCNGSMFWRW